MHTEEFPLVEMWLKKNPVRWVAGVLAGFFAGAVMLGFAMVLSSLGGLDFWYPVRIFATVILGPDAMAYGAGPQTLAVGFIFAEFLCGFLGFVYAHFTGNNHFPSLLGIGVTWALFSWIFINNLFSPSIRAIYVMEVHQGAALFVWLVFGLALTSVAFFDRVLRG